MIFLGFSNKTKLQGVSEGFEKVTIVCHQDEIKFQAINLTATRSWNTKSCDLVVYPYKMDLVIFLMYIYKK